SAPHSTISSNARTQATAPLVASIIFADVELGDASHSATCIVDKHVRIPPNTQIGINKVEDAKRFKISEKGIVVIPESYQF
ncbi:glucose-1-phosphate adenylyltransferase, partial [Vibrio sp. 1562]|nr:glucose-1-phosphate adenylyltransferase [Vibrio sp. 1562]